MKPLLVYLDQSVWSALEQPTSAYRELETLGRDGDAAFLISPEILMETAALEVGRQRRWKTLRRFPGTVWVPGLSADWILSRDAQALVAKAAGTQPSPPIHVDPQPFSEVRLDELEQAVRSLRLQRNLLHQGASARRISRSADRGKSKQERQGDERRTAAFLRADMEEFFRLAERPLGRHERAVARGLAHLVQPAANWVAAKGYLAPFHKRLDPVFTSCVLPLLPDDARADPQLVRRILTLWNTEPRARLAPSIGCAAAAFERAHYAPVRDDGEDYPGSEELDQRHACFAPLVDVFTCDRRNADPVRRALQRADHSTSVAVAGRPDDVLNTLEKRIRGREAPR